MSKNIWQELDVAALKDEVLKLRKDLQGYPEETEMLLGVISLLWKEVFMAKQERDHWKGLCDDLMKTFERKATK